ncbi:hypothetical protein E2C01_062814 [Portunus trituberculatus]|uniref:Uncharacterized protein n=1 Tax=Portunus trituberculatus TaxID=210409 RepID=A0A5B7HC54_PORTR|nr:hypothetical protein [Portunus trituberculatus]
MSPGSRVVHCVAAKFEFKSPSVHSVVCDHPTVKGEFRQAEICQVRGLTVQHFEVTLQRLIYVLDRLISCNIWY